MTGGRVFESRIPNPESSVPSPSRRSEIVGLQDLTSIAYAALDNVVITPHMRGTTHDSNARSRKMPVDNIIAWIEGKPEHVVNL